MGVGDDLAHRVDRSQNVGHVADGHDPGPRPQQGAVGVQVQPAIVGHRNEPQHDPLAFAQEVPGHDVGVVLHLRKHDLVPGDQRLTEGRRYQVHRLGRALGEHDLTRAGGAHQPPHLLAGGLVGLGGLIGQGVHAAMDVGVGRLHGPLQGLDHRPRLLSRSGAVQVDQRMAVHLALQDRELSPHFLHIKGHGADLSFSATHALTTSRAPSCSIRSTTSPTKASVSIARASGSAIPRCWA